MKKQLKPSTKAALFTSILLVVGSLGLAGGSLNTDLVIYMDAGGGSGKIAAKQVEMTVAANSASAQAAAKEQQLRARLEALGVWVD